MDGFMNDNHGYCCVLCPVSVVQIMCDRIREIGYDVREKVWEKVMEFHLEIFNAK